MKPSIYSLSVSACAALACLLTACSSTQPQPAKEVVTIATEASHPPFAYINKDKQLAGFDINLMNELCQSMAVECNIVHDNFHNLLPSLKQGKYDAVIAAMSANEDSADLVDFTDSYYTDNFALIVNNQANLDTQTMKEASIAVLHGSDAALLAEQRYADAYITGFKTQSSAFIALSEFTKDAVFADKSTIDDWLNSHGNADLYTVLSGQNTKNYAIAVQKDSDLRQKLNKALVTYKKSGKYQTLYDEYFVEAQWEKTLPTEMILN